MEKLTAKFNGKCFVCGLTINAGNEIEWSKATGAKHLECQQSDELVFSDEEVFEVSGVEGGELRFSTNLSGWQVGDVIHNKDRSAGSTWARKQAERADRIKKLGREPERELLKFEEPAGRPVFYDHVPTETALKEKYKDHRDSYNLVKTEFDAARNHYWDVIYSAWDEKVGYTELRKAAEAERELRQQQWCEAIKAIKAEYAKNDGPEFFTVLRIVKHYTPYYDGGEGGGETDYTAYCRTSTEEEAQPVKESLEQTVRRNQAREQLTTIVQKIADNGERPEKAEIPEGPKIVIREGHYQSNEYLLIEPKFIWRVLYNGRDGDLWSVNNLGGHSIAVRIAFDANLAKEIEDLAKICETA